MQGLRLIPLMGKIKQCKWESGSCVCFLKRKTQPGLARGRRTTVVGSDHDWFSHMACPQESLYTSRKPISLEWTPGDPFRDKDAP